MDDRAVVERQIGRPPRAFRRVAVRCPFGLPAVTEQSPYGPGGEPFPTTYYLTCRHLVAAIARLEAAGGVERWSAAVRARAGAAGEPRAGRRPSSARCAASWPAARPGKDGGASLDARDRRLARAGSLKCLHAHAAFALARPGYELGERILAEVAPLWPPAGAARA